MTPAERLAVLKREIYAMEDLRGCDSIVKLIRVVSHSTGNKTGFDEEWICLVLEVCACGE